MPQTLHTGDVQDGAIAPLLARRYRPTRFRAYSSANGELYWELDVKSDEMGPDTHVRLRIEVVLHPAPKEEDIFAGGLRRRGLVVALDR